MPGLLEALLANLDWPGLVLHYLLWDSEDRPSWVVPPFTPPMWAIAPPRNDPLAADVWPV